MSTASLRLANKSLCRLYDAYENRAWPSFLRPTDSMVAVWSGTSSVSSDARRQENINGRRWRKVEIAVPSRAACFASFCRNMFYGAQNSDDVFPDYNSCKTRLKQLISRDSFWEGMQAPTLCIGPKKIDEEIQEFGLSRWDYLLPPHRHVTALVRGDDHNLIAGLVSSPISVEGYSPFEFIAVWQLIKNKPNVAEDYSPGLHAHNIASLQVCTMYTPKKLDVWFGHGHLNLLVLCTYWRSADLSLKLFQLPLSTTSIPKYHGSDARQRNYPSQPLYLRAHNAIIESWAP